MELLFQPAQAYKNFTFDHYLPIALLASFFILTIWISQRYDEEKKHKILYIPNPIYGCCHKDDVYKL